MSASNAHCPKCDLSIPLVTLRQQTGPVFISHSFRGVTCPWSGKKPGT